MALTACGSVQPPALMLANDVQGSRCSQLPQEDRDISHLYMGGNMQRVEALYGSQAAQGDAPATRASLRSPHRVLVGATLHVPAPAESAAYVERQLTCHASATARPEDHPNDPLRVAGVQQVRVTEHGSMLGITVTGADAQASRHILQRAEALKANPGQVKVRQVAAATGPTPAF